MLPFKRERPGNEADFSLTCLYPSVLHLEFCKCPFSHFRDVFIPDRESKAYDDS